MDNARVSEPPQTTNQTTTEHTERELIVTRTFDGPARIVFKAWTTPDLLMRWWVPKSFGITFISCEVDARTGGSYKFVFGHPYFEKPMAFFGRYLEVVPNARLVWTNEEGEDASVTTVTFEEKDGKTLLVLRELYPSKDAFAAAIASGSVAGYDEQFVNLDQLIVTEGAGL